MHTRLENAKAFAKLVWHLQPPETENRALVWLPNLEDVDVAVLFLLQVWILLEGIQNISYWCHIDCWASRPFHGCTWSVDHPLTRWSRTDKAAVARVFGHSSSRSGSWLQSFRHRFSLVQIETMESCPGIGGRGSSAHALRGSSAPRTMPRGHLYTHCLVWVAGATGGCYKGTRGTSGWDGWGMLQGNKWVGWVGNATRKQGEQVGGMGGGCYKGTSGWDGWGMLQGNKWVGWVGNATREQGEQVMDAKKEEVGGKGGECYKGTRGTSGWDGWGMLQGNKGNKWVGWVGDATREQVGGMGGECYKGNKGNKWVGWMLKGEEVGGKGGGMVEGNKWVGWVGNATREQGEQVGDGWGMLEGNKWVGWVGDATREQVGGMGGECYKGTRGTSGWDGWGMLQGNKWVGLGGECYKGTSGWDGWGMLQGNKGNKWVGWMLKRKKWEGKGGGMVEGNKWVGWVGNATREQVGGKGTSGWDGWGMLQGNKWEGWVGDATREQVGGMGNATKGNKENKCVGWVGDATREQLGGMGGECYKGTRGTSGWDGWGCYKGTSGWMLQGNKGNKWVGWVGEATREHVGGMLQKNTGRAFVSSRLKRGIMLLGPFYVSISLSIDLSYRHLPFLKDTHSHGQVIPLPLFFFGNQVIPLHILMIIIINIIVLFIITMIIIISIIIITRSECPSKFQQYKRKIHCFGVQPADCNGCGRHDTFRGIGLVSSSKHHKLPAFRIVSFEQASEINCILNCPAKLGF